MGHHYEYLHMLEVLFSNSCISTSSFLQEEKEKKERIKCLLPKGHYSVYSDRAPGENVTVMQSKNLGV